MKKRELSPKRQIINSLFPTFVAIVVLIISVPLITYAYFARDLETKERIMNRKDAGLTLLDKNGEPFFTFYEAKSKTTVELKDIPLHTQQAVIAIEDKDFYNHPGFSLKAIFRAFFANIRDQGISQGGSTITQQLVKNALLNPEKSFTRKYQELVLAEEVERRFSKKQILEMYLNSVYFGEGAVGIEEAAQAYFSKSAKELSLAESAMLAGVLPAPSVYSPISGDIQKAKTRQKLVLQKMVEEKYISEQQRIEAEKAPLHFAQDNDRLNSLAPHFALWIKDQLIKKYGEERVIRSGFRVKTTLDTELQAYAETVVKAHVEDLKANNVSNGAAVIIDPKTSEVRAMVGSKDWYNDDFGKVNIALRLRQPGSSFKPFVFAAAMEKGVITPATMLHDRKTTFQGRYEPANYDGKFRGDVTARRALANSLNIPAVEVLSKIGVPAALEIAERFGISSLKDPSNYGLSLVLGSGEVSLLELTNAYAVFANEGTYNNPISILQIIDKDNKTLYNVAPTPKKVLDPKVAFLISSILSDNQARVETFGNALTISKQAAVKTGTTDNYRDAWTVGYTPSAVVGVWVGNNDGKAMDTVAGALGAAPIWRQLIEKATQGRGIETFQPPAGITRLLICGQNGLIAREATSSAFPEYFINTMQPVGECQIRSENPPVTPNVSISPTATPQPTVLPTQVPTIMMVNPT